MGKILHHTGWIYFGLTKQSFRSNIKILILKNDTRPIKENTLNVIVFEFRPIHTHDSDNEMCLFILKNYGTYNSAVLWYAIELILRSVVNRLISEYLSSSFFSLRDSNLIIKVFVFLTTATDAQFLLQETADWRPGLYSCGFNHGRLETSKNLWTSENVINNVIKWSLNFLFAVLKGDKKVTQRERTLSLLQSWGACMLVFMLSTSMGSYRVTLGAAVGNRTVISRKQQSVETIR